MDKKFISTGIWLVFSGIILGAFAAHALKQWVTEAALKSFETGVDYQLFHGLAFIVLGILFKAHFETDSGFLRKLYPLFLSGLILFSGSIYLLALKEGLSFDIKILGPITPIGGTLLIIAWAWLGIRFLKLKKQI
ncbi:MAG: DUF423 domain-containing protein [Flavobacteriaceae bacterium]|nr:DUF423 domain-containing protein [Flavobacteriaceae bacterium]